MEEATKALKKENKQLNVQKMFSSAAKSYDFVNSLLSVGMHRKWKKFAIKQTSLKPGDKAIDICSGTHDLAILMSKMVGKNGHITAADLNPEMVAVGDQKVAKLGLQSQIKSMIANAQELPLPDNQFNAATVAFGIRNVDDIGIAFSEMCRVLKPGGKAVCLEFSKPVSFIFRFVYDFYSLAILPFLGKFVSGDKTGIYYYLPKSIRLFPDQEKLKNIMKQSGFKEVNYINLCGGIVAVHIGIK